MTVISFDTLAFAKKLKGTGMSSTMAEAQAQETGKIINDLISNELVTKQDLKEELNNIKLDMYSFTIKVATFTVGILGGIQSLLHFIK